MKQAILIAFTLLGSLKTYAQYGPISTRPTETEESNQTTTEERDLSTLSFMERLSVGGNFALSFGSTTYIEVSPRVGYRFTNHLLGGVGVNYIYSKIPSGFYWTGSPSSEFSVYGAHEFTTYSLPIQLPLVLHQEFELLNYEVPSIDQSQRVQYNREWVPGWHIGGGIFQKITPGGSGVYMLLLYNVLYDTNKSLQNSPWSFKLSFML